MVFAAFGILDPLNTSRPQIPDAPLKRISEDLSLLFPHSRPAKLISDPESIQVQRPPKTHLGRHLGVDGDQNRRLIAPLGLSPNRDEHAVADVWSAAGQGDGVGLRATVNLVGNLRRGFLIHPLDSHRLAHIAFVFAGYAAEEPTSGELAQRIDRKHEIDILIGISVIVIALRDHQLR